jgi:hypothetical protein
MTPSLKIQLSRLREIGWWGSSMTDLLEHLELLRQLARGPVKHGRNEAAAPGELVEAGFACLTSEGAQRHYEITPAGRRFIASSRSRVA